MKNNNVDIKSLIIGFLMATCMMMALGANSKPMPEIITLGGGFKITHEGGHQLYPIRVQD